MATRPCMIWPLDYSKYKVHESKNLIHLVHQYFHNLYHRYRLESSINIWMNDIFLALLQSNDLDCYFTSIKYTHGPILKHYRILYNLWNSSPITSSDCPLYPLNPVLNFFRTFRQSVTAHCQSINQGTPWLCFSPSVSWLFWSTAFKSSVPKENGC